MFHEQWKTILDDEFMEAFLHGIVIRCIDAITRRFYPRLFIYSSDYPEKCVCTYLGLISSSVSLTHPTGSLLPASEIEGIVPVHVAWRSCLGSIWWAQRKTYLGGRNCTQTIHIIATKSNEASRSFTRKVFPLIPTELKISSKNTLGFQYRWVLQPLRCTPSLIIPFHRMHFWSGYQNTVLIYTTCSCLISCMSSIRAFGTPSLFIFYASCVPSMKANSTNWIVIMCYCFVLIHHVNISFN